MDSIFEKADFSSGSDHKERLRKLLFGNGGMSMKITDELKGKLENAGSTEEARKILGKTKEAVEEAGIILDDAELDKAAGGADRGLPGGSKSSIKPHTYPWQQ